MTEPSKPSTPLLIGVVVSLLVTVGCTLLPAVNGPASAIDEIAAGLAPGAIVLAITHILHLRRRAAAGLPTRGWVLGVGVAVIAAGGIAGLVAQDAAKSARSAARSARSSYGYGSYGGGYEAQDAARKARHYGDSMMLGFGMAGFGLLLAGAGHVAGRSKELPMPSDEAMAA